FSRRMSLTEAERKEFEQELKDIETAGNAEIAKHFGELVSEVEKVLGKTLTDEDCTPLVRDQDPRFVAERAANFRLSRITATLRSQDRIEEVEKLHKSL